MKPHSNPFKNYQKFTAKHFHTDTVFKAFIANAFVTALIAIFTVEARRMAEEYGDESNLKTETTKGLASFGIGLAVGLVTFCLMWLLFNFGGGMVTINRGMHTITPLFTIAAKE